MRADDPMIVFAYACLRHGFDALLAQQPAAGALPGPDAIHRMRIATRRSRVALRMCARLLPKRAPKLAKELRWFARSLGEVRDLDVYAENFREYAKLVPPQSQQELGGYELHLRRERTEARNDLETLFSNPRVGALLDSFRGLIDAPPRAKVLRRWQSFRVADGAAKYLRKSRRRISRAGRKVGADSSAERLHRLRIRAKRLRYELEFFAAVFPELGQAVKATKRLQDVLGEHQDACTAAQRLRDYARRHESRRLEAGASGRNATALERLLATQEQKAADARVRFAAEWRRFEQTLGNIKLKKLAA